jgi:hypothetical protein
VVGVDASPASKEALLWAAQQAELISRGPLSVGPSGNAGTQGKHFRFLLITAIGRIAGL